ncbi:Pkinase domain containing protein [Lactarius tabidus]
MSNAPTTVPCQCRTEKILSSGTYAIVNEAVHIKTGKYYACKVINMKVAVASSWCVDDGIAVPVLKRVSSTSGHRNIVTQTSNNLYPWFDLCTGGELLDRMFAKGKYHEPDAAGLVRTIMTAVQPENLLFHAPAEDADIMLAGFGLSRVMEEERFHQLTGICGTRGYMAHEIFKKSGHGNPVDIWAMGVITYFLLAGYTPFDRENQQQEMEYGANASNTARDFVNACLTVDPTQRPTAAEILQHRWLADEKSHSVPDPDSTTCGPRDLLPHIQKPMGGTAHFREAVRGVTAMNRMPTLLRFMPQPQANSERRSPNTKNNPRKRISTYHHNQGENKETVDGGAQKWADLASMRNMLVEYT